MFNIGELLIKGSILNDGESRKVAKTKAGVFRGGSVGLILEDGETAVGCPRAALARYIGADPPRDEVEWAYTKLMLESGAASEELWAADLTAALSAHPNIKLLREEEYPIEWTCVGPGGTEVKATGREDLILLDTTSNEVSTLVELKQVSSLNTAVSVLGALKPKLEHTIQAANYSYRTGAPVQLWYVSRVNWSVPEWGFIKTQLGNPHPRIERFLKRGKTSEKITTITPFIIGYQLHWEIPEGGTEAHVFVQPMLHDGPLESITSGRGKQKELTIQTPITVSRIDRFYSQCVAQLESKQLFPHRPRPMEMNGKTHQGFNPCDYCDWQYNCDANESNYEAWVSEVASRIPKE